VAGRSSSLMLRMSPRSDALSRPGRHFMRVREGLAAGNRRLVDLPPDPQSISELSARYSLDAASNAYACCGMARSGQKEDD